MDGLLNKHNSMTENDSYKISAQERKNSSVLIVEPDTNNRTNLRAIVKILGFGFISDVPTHGMALDRLKDRKFNYIFFDSKKTNVSPSEFLTQLLAWDNDSIAIPMSSSPRVDDVFDLFVIGAKSFLVKPFTSESVEESMLWAAKGEPISETVLHAKDRNEALVAMMMTAIDNVATLIRQSRQFQTALRDLPKALHRLKHASELARTFCKGSDDDLVNTIMEFSVNRGAGPATRLGRLRKRLQTNRGDDPKDAPVNS